jgi:hypothetical protein
VKVEMDAYFNAVNACHPPDRAGEQPSIQRLAETHKGQASNGFGKTPEN